MLKMAEDRPISRGAAIAFRAEPLKQTPSSIREDHDMAITDKRPIQVADKDDRHPAVGEVVAEIELEELQEARKDPKWMSFRDGALKYRAGMKKTGRSI